MSVSLLADSRESSMSSDAVENLVALFDEDIDNSEPIEQSLAVSKSSDGGA